MLMRGGREWEECAYTGGGLRRTEASGDRRRQEELRGDLKAKLRGDLKAISHGRCGFACARERLHAGGGGA